MIQADLDYFFALYFVYKADDINLNNKTNRYQDYTFY